MKIVDLTQTLETGSPVFPGYPVPIVHKWTDVEADGYYSNLLMFVEHTGTHVDAPAHFVKGAKTIDEVSPEKFFTEGIVIDVSSLGKNARITREIIEKGLGDVKEEVGKGWIILFYTGYDKYAGKEEWFEHPGLEESGAKFLVELGIDAVGIDAPSIDHDPFPGHKILLPHGVIIYENLTNLDKLLGKRFKFFGAPLKIRGGSASPVRALAIIDRSG